MSSLAEEASSLKPLTGKEKRTLTMLSFIRSRESTRKGELPPNLEGGEGGGREGEGGGEGGIKTLMDIHCKASYLCSVYTLLFRKICQ